MIYTDEENKRWWEGLSNTARIELFDVIEQKTGGDSQFLKSIDEQWARGEKLTPKQLAALRKWAP